MNLGDLMRVLLILLSVFFLTACGSNENELAGIKIGSKLDDIKELNSYELLTGHYQDGKSCVIVDMYYKEVMTDSGRQDLVIASVIDGVVRGVTEEFNLYGRASINSTVIEEKKKSLDKIYGDPISFEVVELAPDYLMHVFDYKETKSVSRIKFMPQYYSDTNSVGYLISLHDDVYLQIENMKEVDSCN